MADQELRWDVEGPQSREGEVQMRAGQLIGLGACPCHIEQSDACAQPASQPAAERNVALAGFTGGSADQHAAEISAVPLCYENRQMCALQNMRHGPAKPPAQTMAFTP